MDSLVSCVPPGFRFHPTDEELVGYYLKKKVAAQKIDLDVIRDVDLYRIEPWDLQECCRIGCEEQTEWYFFSHKDKKYPTGTRTNRATMAGFWKATGRDKAVHDEKKRLIGMRKTLVFYKGRAPNGHKSDWIIHEYRLQTQQDQIASPQEEGWVVCRAFKKRTSNIQITRSYMQEDHNNNYHPFINNISPAYQLENTSLSSQLHLLLHQQLNSSFQLLPQLEAPQNNFLPLSNSSFQRSSLSMIPHNPSLDKNKEEEAEEEQRVCSAAATDWRELDKFVASQLSHEEDDGSDMAALLLLESNEGEEEQVEEEEEEETEQEGEEERRRFGFCS